MKKRFFLIVTMICVSFIVAAQTPVMAVLPFSGEDADICARFTDAVTAEIIRQGRYAPAVMPLSVDPSVSPALIYADVIHAGYALTGAASYREDEYQYHLTLWFWDMGTGDLVCSDAMVCRDDGDMARILPLLVEWILSRNTTGETDAGVAEAAEEPPDSVPEPAAQKAAPPPEKTPPAPADDGDRWLYLGLRGGGSWRPYAEGDKSLFTDMADQAFSWEGAFQVSVHPLPLLALQGEAIFTQDRLSNGGVKISSYSMMFPLLLRFNIRKGDITLAPLGGVYFILPIGDMKFSAAGASSSSSWTHSVPLGYTLGLSTGVKLGPGNLFLDLRYSGDLSAAKLDNAAGSKLYTRSLVSFTLGYEIGIIKRKR
ncbi:MAG: hypothetical protein LBQ38_06000 [Spirochaetaceae bacterium]|jgi:hypothetical protein|nr:hypothetical protein [Spirochaetaceae bacterium]